MSRSLRPGLLPVVMGAVAALGVAWLASRRVGRSVAGKLVLVTGGSRGLGMLLARAFAEAGARVVICARDERALELAVARLRSIGLDVDSYVCDVTDRSGVACMVADIEATRGSIDVVVNNAGLLHFGPALAVTHEDMRRAMDTNFWGAVHVIDAVLPSMLARHDGRIVNICSVGGISPVPFTLPYSASKAALNGYSLDLGYDLAGTGVSVTVVHPFAMRTGGAINGVYRGDTRRGLYAAVALADTNPLLSIDPARVARKVVRAAARRDSIVFVGWRTRILAVLQGTAPRMLARVYRAVCRTLPQPSTSEGERGQEMTRALKDRWRTVAERSRAKNNQPRPI